MHLLDNFEISAEVEESGDVLSLGTEIDDTGLAPASPLELSDALKARLQAEGLRDSVRTFSSLETGPEDRSASTRNRRSGSCWIQKRSLVDPKTIRTHCPATISRENGFSRRN